jgi:hypothetical protein
MVTTAYKNVNKQKVTRKTEIKNKLSALFNKLPWRKLLDVSSGFKTPLPHHTVKNIGIAIRKTNLILFKVK